MRRFLAYIVMLVTMLCAIIFNTQTVLENKIDAMEYGTGTELVYSLTNRVASDYDAETHPDIDNEIDELESADIEDKVMDRLDDAGVRNANVSIVKGDKDQDGYQLRVSLSPLTDTELANVKEIIAYQGWLSISTEGDTFSYYETNDQFFVDRDDDDVAELLYSGTKPYPVLNIRDADSYDTLKTQAEEASNNNVSEARRFNAEGDESEEKTATKVYLWMNKTVDDTYDKAFGTHETVIQQEVKSKVIAEIDISNWDSDNLQLGITADTDGNEFTISTARAFVNMLNSEDYGYDIAFLYENSISATFGSSAITLTFVIYGIVLLVFAALMIAFYGLAGLTGAVTMLGTVLLTFFLFSVLGFEFSVAALGGLAVVVCLSIMISVNYFERVKAELKAGRDIVKANQLGYHKSFLTTLDTSLVCLIASVFSFLISIGSMKTFFGVIMIGTIVTFFVTNYINKWMLYWLVKDNAELNLPFFSFHKIAEKINEKVAKPRTYASADKKHVSHKTMAIFPIVAALACSIGLTAAFLISGRTSFFQTYSNFSDGYVLNIQFNDNSQSYEPLSITENYVNYIIGIGKLGETDNTIGTYKAVKEADKNTDHDFIIYDDTATVNVVEKSDEDGYTYYVHYFSVQVDKDLSALVPSNGDTVDEIIEKGMGSEYDVDIDETHMDISPLADSHYEDDTLVVGCYVLSPTNIVHSSEYLILVVFMISLFTIYYFFVRYGLNIALAAAGSGSLASALYLGLLAILRIPYSSYTCFAPLIAVTLLNLFLVPVLARNREVLKERGLRKTATSEERASIASECLQKALPMIVPVVGIGLVYSIALAFVNTALIGLSIASILFLVLDVVILVFFTVPFYHFLATHVSFKAISDWFKKLREARAKKKGIKLEEAKKVSPDGVIYVDDGPHETIIPGLNDFRTF